MKFLIPLLDGNWKRLVVGVCTGFDVMKGEGQVENHSGIHIRGLEIIFKSTLST